MYIKLGSSIEIHRIMLQIIRSHRYEHSMHIGKSIKPVAIKQQVYRSKNILFLAVKTAKKLHYVYRSKNLLFLAVKTVQKLQCFNHSKNCFSL